MEAQSNTEQVHPDFLKGFNEGYLIHQEMPELATILNEAVKSDSERSAGFRAGYAQYELEHDKSLYPEWMNKSTEDRDDYDLGKDLDKDDYEPSMD